VEGHKRQTIKRQAIKRQAIKRQAMKRQAIKRHPLIYNRQDGETEFKEFQN
jgi:hypothetical protein